MGMANILKPVLIQFEAYGCLKENISVTLVILTVVLVGHWKVSLTMPQLSYKG